MLRRVAAARIARRFHSTLVEIVATVCGRIRDETAVALAGRLMGLLSWLVAAARDTINQVAITFIIGAVIAFAHLHHVVAGSVEVLLGVFAGQGVTPADFAHFLFWTALGNAIGGPLFVSLIKYGHAIGSAPRPRENR